MSGGSPLGGTYLIDNIVSDSLVPSILDLGTHLISYIYDNDTISQNIFIGNISSLTTDLIVCDSYEWNDSIYTESGVYTFNTTNSFGCDSTAILNLTINNSSFLLQK